MRTKFGFTALISVVLTCISCEREKAYLVPIDGDGNEYQTIQIGTETWMLGELRTTTFNDGTPITQRDDWQTANTEPAFCYYDNDPNSGIMLYNWLAVQSGKLAPKGWHVATSNDWTNLARQFGGWDEAAAALKSLTGWAECDSAEIYITNDSQLDLKPTGCRETYLDTIGYHNAEFHSRGEQGFWWTSSPAPGSGGMMMEIRHNSNELIGSSASNNFAAAVLCVRDK